MSTNFAGSFIFHVKLTIGRKRILSLLMCVLNPQDLCVNSLPVENGLRAHDKCCVTCVRKCLVRLMMLSSIRSDHSWPSRCDPSSSKHRGGEPEHPRITVIIKHNIVNRGRDLNWVPGSYFTARMLTRISPD